MLMKRLVLISFIVLFGGTIIYAYTHPQPTVDRTTMNEKTCTSASKSLKSAGIQKQMLDQQVLIQKASGQFEDAAITSSKLSELDGIITIFERLIADPKLECKKYLKPS